ncbi:DinB family protein [Streptomyces sp. NPDC058284]|uniref:DinB family protein n=1 Tax=unclassified Streptomyces TaxID=2593676 RepID=UPI00364EFBD3
MDDAETSTANTTGTTTRHVPHRGGEKESLHVALDRHRDVVLWKLEGLTEEQMRRPMTPSGTSLLGLVKHLAAVEYGWFCETFGLGTEPLWFDPETEDMAAADDETAERITAFYGRARAAADRAIAGTGLDDVGTAWDGRRVTMRWVLIHMLEETARHAGHMDIVRELIDGATGDHPEIAGCG